MLRQIFEPVPLGIDVELTQAYRLHLMGWTRQQSCTLCSQIAFLRILGYSFNEVADKVQTEDHPAGVSHRMTFKHIKEHAPDFKAIQDWMNLNKREKSINVKVLAADTVKKELEGMLGDSAATLLQAIRDGDVEAAKWCIEQSIGKPTQTTKLTGGVIHGHLVFDPRPIRELAMQENDMVNSVKLLRMLPGEVTNPDGELRGDLADEPIEAEIVGPVQ